MADNDAIVDPQAKKPNIDYPSLVTQSEAFVALQAELVSTVNISTTGITNLVVNYEDPFLVKTFLRSCYNSSRLYNETVDIDAVDLQQGAPGRGNASSYLDELIYGTYKMLPPDPTTGMPAFDIDKATGSRKRNADGFISRAVALTGKCTDKVLVIKNIDHCLDFCPNTPGCVQNTQWLFDNFRNPIVRKTMKLLLVSNIPLKFPFKIRRVELPKVNDYEANHVIDSVSKLYLIKKYKIGFTDNQRTHICRKLTGLTYSESTDVILAAISNSCEEMLDAKGNPVVDSEGKPVKVIDGKKVVKLLREKINSMLMEDSFGLTHLTPRPWEDYICAESSGFTYDVRKILRDLNEIKRLSKIRDVLESTNRDASATVKTIEAIQMRMPHIIVLYGSGGVGKSAFPIHLAGLLEFDIWDFNIMATHSKWIGEGPERMRETLKKVSKATHMIVRVDEYDRGMGSTGEAGSGMHEAHKQVEAEFMNWLQNCQEENVFVKNNIFIVMTTNHKENITGPMLRSGRSDLVIGIDNFDTKSMIEAFDSAARRMTNRGVKVVGFDNATDLSTAINTLDKAKLAEIAMTKGFTVRDIDVFIIEMAAHAYYKKITGEGLEWNTENFVKVLERSQGSTRDNTTGELVIGDRFIYGKEEDKDVVAEAQKYFDFYDKDPANLNKLKVFDQK